MVTFAMPPPSLGACTSQGMAERDGTAVHVVPHRVRVESVKPGQGDWRGTGATQQGHRWRHAIADLQEA